MIHKSEALLDIPMLEQYLELVGPKLITDGLAVFEKMMPGYVSVLESNLTAQDKKGIVEEGHKTTGAVAPVFNIVTFTSPLPTHRYLNNIFIIEMIVGGSEEDYHRKAG